MKLPVADRARLAERLIASLDEDVFKRSIVINGVSKSYSMTGWRIGYMYFHTPNGELEELKNDIACIKEMEEPR